MENQGKSKKENEFTGLRIKTKDLTRFEKLSSKILEKAKIPEEVRSHLPNAELFAYLLDAFESM